MTDRVPLTIRPGDATDARELAALATRTFWETFGPVNRFEDVDDYVSRVYGEEQQRRELDDPSIATLLGFVDGTLAAFVQLRRAAHAPEVDSPSAVEIARFYVDGPFQGRGIAQALMDASVNAAREMGAGDLWLGVWEKNARAIAFYARCGFRDAGSHPFLLGSDLQTDRVMLRRI